MAKGEKAKDKDARERKPDRDDCQEVMTSMTFCVWAGSLHPFVHLIFIGRADPNPDPFTV